MKILEIWILYSTAIPLQYFPLALKIHRNKTVYINQTDLVEITEEPLSYSLSKQSRYLSYVVIDGYCEVVRCLTGD
jgi:hypothetical protein